MPPRIVVVPPSHADTADMARKMAPAGFELVMAPAAPAELMPALASAEYLVCYPNVKSSDAFFKAAPKLKLYQLLSAGYDDVDLEAARRAKVPVCNNGGANAISVSEHAIMLMLTVSKPAGAIRRAISPISANDGGTTTILGGIWLPWRFRALCFVRQ